MAALGTLGLRSRWIQEQAGKDIVFVPSEVLAGFPLGGLLHPKSRQVFKCQMSVASMVAAEASDTVFFVPRLWECRDRLWWLCCPNQATSVHCLPCGTVTVQVVCLWAHAESALQPPRRQAKPSISRSR